MGTEPKLCAIVGLVAIQKYQLQEVHVWVHVQAEQLNKYDSQLTEPTKQFLQPCSTVMFQLQEKIKETFSPSSVRKLSPDSMHQYYSNL